MSWARAGQLSTVCISLVVIAVVLVKRAKDWYHAPLTVEQEDEQCRGVIAHIGPERPTVGDYPDAVDDPVWAIVNVMHSNNTAQM